RRPGTRMAGVRSAPRARREPRSGRGAPEPLRVPRRRAVDRARRRDRRAVAGPRRAARPPGVGDGSRARDARRSPRLARAARRGARAVARGGRARRARRRAPRTRHPRGARAPPARGGVEPAAPGPRVLRVPHAPGYGYARATGAADAVLGARALVPAARADARTAHRRDPP